MKRTFMMKQKGFFIIFKGLSLKQMKQIILDGESLTLKSSQNLMSFELQLLKKWQIYSLYGNIKYTS